MSKKKKPEASPQHLQKLALNLTAPMKFDNMEIELRSIAVFVGANDSGKSFLLKVAFALSAVGCSKDAPGGTVEQAAQFIFDNTFSNNNLDGTLKAIYTRGSLSVELKEGKVIKVEIVDLEEPAPMTYMSTNIRTFSNMDLYLKMRHEAGGDPVLFVKKMLGAYRLYDFTYMEALISRCPFKVPEIIRDVLRKEYDFKESICSLEIDEEKNTFVAVAEDGTKRPMSTYGSGHQAILNMLLGVSQ